MKLPNIIILMLDSARLDKFSCYGYKRKTTPNIDKISKESTIFTDAITQGPWTLPSHTSLFTGLYPYEHKKTNGFNLSGLNINKSIQTLPEILSKKGYVSLGLSSNPWIGKLTDLDTRFDAFIGDNLKITGDIKPGYKLSRMCKGNRYINKLSYVLTEKDIISNIYIDHNKLSKIFIEILTNWIEKQKKPFFAFVNLMNCHNPYFPPKDILMKFNNKQKTKPGKLNVKINNFVCGKEKPNKELEREVHNYYDSCLNYVDREIGKLISFMKQKKIIDDTLIIITSDHGKNLGEYKRKNLLHYVKDINIKIPLIVKYKGIFKPKKIDKTVQLMDIFYTILEIVGIKENPNTTEIRKSLQTKIKNKVKDFAYYEVDLPFSGDRPKELDLVKCLKKGEHKLIHSKIKGYFLLNSKRDIKENKDFSKQNKREFNRLKQELNKTKEKSHLLEIKI